MDHHKLVLPEFINDQGALFGGYLLKWIDEFAFITASLDYPGNKFVTIAMDQVVFRHPIKCGQILRFSIVETKLGNTSVEYSVEVYGSRKSEEKDKILFHTKITFVNISELGHKEVIKKQ